MGDDRRKEIDTRRSTRRRVLTAVMALSIEQRKLRFGRRRRPPEKHLVVRRPKKTETKRRQPSQSPRRKMPANVTPSKRTSSKKRIFCLARSVVSPEFLQHSAGVAPQAALPSAVQAASFCTTAEKHDALTHPGCPTSDEAEGLGSIGNGPLVSFDDWNCGATNHYPVHPPCILLLEDDTGTTETSFLHTCEGERNDTTHHEKHQHLVHPGQKYVHETAQPELPTVMCEHPGQHILLSGGRGALDVDLVNLMDDEEASAQELGNGSRLDDSTATSNSGSQSKALIDKADDVRFLHPGEAHLYIPEKESNKIQDDVDLMKTFHQDCDLRQPLSESGQSSPNSAAVLISPSNSSDDSFAPISTSGKVPESDADVMSIKNLTFIGYDQQPFVTDGALHLASSRMGTRQEMNASMNLQFSFETKRNILDLGSYMLSDPIKMSSGVRARFALKGLQSSRFRSVSKNPVLV